MEKLAEGRIVARYLEVAVGKWRFRDFKLVGCREGSFFGCHYQAAPNHAGAMLKKAPYYSPRVVGHNEIVEN